MTSEPTEQNVDVLKRSLATIRTLRQRLDETVAAAREPVAVIGMACRFPGGCDSPDAYWELLCSGGEGVIPVPPDRWDAQARYQPPPVTFGSIYVKEGNFLQREVDTFDARFFGISPAEANAMDPQQRLLLEVGWEALENAGQDATRLRGSDSGVFVGISGTSEYGMLARDNAKVNQYNGTGVAASVASGRLAYVLGWNGPALSVDTACSSSLVSTHLAVEALRRRECGLALAGGVSLMLSPYVMSTLCLMNAVAPDGRTHPFDASGRGYGRGEGCGVVVLKRLSDAVRDGDTVYAVIRGSAVNNDGASSGLTVPNGRAQEAAIRAALAAAGVEPDEVGYLETHGTGTPLGDPIEVQALAKVFGGASRGTDPLVLGAVKGNIGHLESAAGVAGLIKTVLCLHHGVIPPIVNCTEVNPRIALDSVPAVLPREATPWPGDPDRGRVAGLSSFGFSGTNAHVVLAAAPAAAPAEPTAPRAQVLTLSGRDEQALVRSMRRLAAHLEEHPDAALDDVAYVANACRPTFLHRAAFVAGTTPAMRDALRSALAQVADAGTVYGDGDGSEVARGATFRAGFERTACTPLGDAGFAAKCTDQIEPKLVFVLPGELDDPAGATAALREAFPQVEDVAREVAGDLAGRLGVEVAQLWPPQEAAATDDDLVDARLFVAQYVTVRFLESVGIRPEVTTGAGTGHLVAAVLAGLLGRDAALDAVVALRDLRRSAAKAVHLRVTGAAGALEAVTARLAPLGADAAVTAVYSDADLVVSALPSALDAVRPLLAETGAQVRETAGPWLLGADRGSVSWGDGGAGPDAADGRGSIRFVRGTDGVLAAQDGTGGGTAGPADVLGTARHDLVARTLREQGYRHLVVIGGRGAAAGESPGAVPLLSSADVAGELLAAVARLVCLGTPVDWAAFYAGRRHRKIMIPNYPFEGASYWHALPEGGATGAPGADDALPAHGLDGRVLDVPTGPWQAEYLFSATNFPELGDNSGVVHMGYYLELLTAALDRAPDAAVTVPEMEFLAPVIVEPGTVRRVMLVLDRPEAAGQRFRFFSKAGEEPDWTLHVQGTVRVGAGDDPAGAGRRVDLAPVEARCPAERSAAEFYTPIEERGFSFGPSVRWVEQARQGEEEVLVAFRALTPADGNPGHGLGFHPGVLDSCAQACNHVALDRSAAGEKFMIHTLRDVRIVPGRPDGALRAHVRLASYDEERREVRAGVTVVDGGGSVVLSIGSAELRHFDASRLGDMRAVVGATADGGLDREFLTRLAVAAAAEQARLVEQYVQSLLAIEMEFDTPDELDLDAPLRDLGLDSLIGLRFFTRLRRHLGIDMSMSELIQADSVRRTAALVRRQLVGGGPDPEDGATAVTVPALTGPDLWIYRHQARPGATVRLFCFPHGFGSADMYKDWQEALGPQVDVCPIKLPGLDVERITEPAPRDLDDLMSTLEGVLDDELFDLPCAAFGHSWGSLFAYRLAYRLSANPRCRFAKLLVSGYTAPVLPNTSSERILAALAELGFGSFPTIEEVRAAQAEDEVSMAFIRAWGHESDFVQAALDGARLALPGMLAAYGLVERFHRVPEEAFDVPIVGFHGLDDNRVPWDDMVAWGRVTTAGFRLETLAGDHGFIEKDQSEGRLLELLSAELRGCAPARV